jgi:hypothetical protein
MTEGWSHMSAANDASAMTTAINDILPTAKECLRIAAEKEAEKHAEYLQQRKVVEAEKKALLGQLENPSGITDEERMQRASIIIKRAIGNGLTEVEVGRFPNTLCTDRGRALNQQEAGWQTTLKGLPKELFEFWKRHLQPRGYRLKFQIVEWPNGMPGDISVTLSWG